MVRLGISGPIRTVNAVERMTFNLVKVSQTVLGILACFIIDFVFLRALALTYLCMFVLVTTAIIRIVQRRGIKALIVELTHEPAFIVVWSVSILVPLAASGQNAYLSKRVQEWGDAIQKDYSQTGFYPPGSTREVNGYHLYYYDGRKDGSAPRIIFQRFGYGRGVYSVASRRFSDGLSSP
jgi:hypothetical protein